MPEPDFLTPKQVAAILGFSVKTVYRHLKTLAIPGYRVTPDAEWRIPRSWVEPRMASKITPADLRAALDLLAVPTCTNVSTGQDRTLSA